MKIVRKPGVKTRAFTNSVRSEAPSTISGVAMGRKISRFVAPRPRKRWRTIASATIVPRTVATIVESAPISSDLMTASRIPGTASQWTQLSSVKPSQR